MNNKIKKMHKKEDKIKYEEYDNSFILPRKIVDKAPGWGLGGLLDSNRLFVELSAYHGGWIDQGGYYEFDDYEVSDETIVYMGLFFKHWGHFLVDLLPRLWFISSYPEIANKCKIAYIGEDEPNGNYLLLLNLLGIKEKQLIHITKPTQFKKIIVPAYSCRPCIWYSEEYVKMFDTIVDNALEDYQVPDNLQDIDKVYFSRTAFGKASGTEFGEDMIENIYKDNGYKILYPEKLSLYDQIYVWNHVNRIACINGSIPLNLVFCKNKGMKLDILNKTSQLHLNPYLYFLMREVKYEHIDVYIEPYRWVKPTLGSGPFLLSVTQSFKEYLKVNNMNNKYSSLSIYIHNCMNIMKYTYRVINPVIHLKLFIYPVYKKIMELL